MAKEKAMWETMVENVDPENREATLGEYKMAYDFLVETNPKAEIAKQFKKAIDKLEKDS
jgi:hypothetical protein